MKRPHWCLGSSKDAGHSPSFLSVHLLRASLQLCDLAIHQQISCLEALGIPFGHSSTMVIRGMGSQKSQTWNLLSLLRVKDFYTDLSYTYSTLVITKPNCFLSVRCSWVKFFTKHVLYVACLTLLCDLQQVPCWQASPSAANTSLRWASVCCR